MKKLQCNNCGGPLTYISGDKYKCEYCGTTYTITDETPNFIKMVEVLPPACKTFTVKTKINRYDKENYPEDMLANRIIDDMSYKIVDTLKEYLKITKDFDPTDGGEIYRGYIRIVPPDYRF